MQIWQKLSVAFSSMTFVVVAGCCSCPNLTDQKKYLVEYHESGKYQRDIAAVTARAKRFIEMRADSSPTNLVIVFDVDETALSDWNYMASIDFGFDQTTFEQWVERADAPAIQPVLELFKDARALGVHTFFVTGRKEHLRQATVRNLAAAGYENFSGLFMLPESGPTISTADFKKSVRAKLVNEGWIIIANIGDQECDLSGGMAERAFKIPNPFYYGD